MVVPVPVTWFTARSSVTCCDVGYRVDRSLHWCERNLENGKGTAGGGGWICSGCFCFCISHSVLIRVGIRSCVRSGKGIEMFTVKAIGEAIVVNIQSSLGLTLKKPLAEAMSSPRLTMNDRRSGVAFSAMEAV
ncbi:MAG: hypothetical protein M2R45_03844 [Verrucomicrobia subdivision 3 bacterium]|nr:hypothetical protein [Limisphaerales bacterium]MCS1415800.1 hypothetical protein [Limisphaerales bacterium]